MGKDSQLNLNNPEDAQQLIDLLHHIKNSCSYHEITDLTPAGKISIQFNKDSWSELIDTITKLKSPEQVKVLVEVSGGMVSSAMANVENVEIEVRDHDAMQIGYGDPLAQFLEAELDSMSVNWEKAGYPYIAGVN